MNPRKIPLAIQRHYRRVRSAGRRLAGTWGEEDIHQFRVEVKKLRACLRLAAAARAGVHGRLPGKLRVFYGMTGIIRTLQLQRKGLEDAAARLGKNIPDACGAYLEGCIETATAAAKQHLKLSSPFGRGRPQWHAPMQAHMPEKAASAFIEERKRCLDLSVDGFPDEEGLHAIRKAMKDILYAWPCLFGSEHGPSLPEPWQSRAALRTLTDVLGEFHDICIRLQLLQDSHFLLMADEQSGGFLKDVRALWCRDRDEKLEQLRHMLLPAGATNDENPFAPINLNTSSYELHVD